MRDLRRDPLRAEARHDTLCNVVAAAITAVTAVGSAVVGAHAADKAGDKQVAAANASNALQRGMFDDIRGDLSPYNELGKGYALPGLQRFLSGNPAEVQAQLESTPGYQFTRTQGLKAVQNGAAARGLGVSGAALKGAASYATGLADTTFGAQFNRFLDAARLGESAAAQTGSFGTSTAQSMGGNLIGAGNAQAGATVGAANALTGGINGIANAYVMNRILGGGGGGGMYGGAGIPSAPYDPSMNPIT